MSADMPGVVRIERPLRAVHEHDLPLGCRAVAADRHVPVGPVTGGGCRARVPGHSLVHQAIFAQDAARSAPRGAA